MLISSNVNFFYECSKMAVQFEINKLNSTIRESILAGNTKANIDSNKIYLVNAYDKHTIALLYNVEMIDARIGWLLMKMCISSDNLGFVISPMTRWHRHRIIECYKAVKGNLYNAYLDLQELNKGVVYLVIDWTDFLKKEV